MEPETGFCGVPQKAAGKELLIFDEPTSGLDYAHMRDVAENIIRLAHAGKTVFIITHDPELIAACCNYLIFLDGGKLVWSGGWSEAIITEINFCLKAVISREDS